MSRVSLRLRNVRVEVVDGESQIIDPAVELSNIEHKEAFGQEGVHPLSGITHPSCSCTWRHRTGRHGKYDWHDDGGRDTETPKAHCSNGRGGQSGQSSNRAISVTVQMWSSMPAAIAGVRR